jgi:hypothetical protein
MRPRIFLPLLGAGALLIGTGVAVRVASAGERPRLTAEYTEAGVWSGGLVGTFTIRNPAGQAEDWKLTFDLSDGASVAGIWNGRLAATDLGSYTITPQSAALPAGGVATVGFTAATTKHVKPVNCRINGTECTIAVQPDPPSVVASPSAVASVPSVPSRSSVPAGPSSAAAHAGPSLPASAAGSHRPPVSGVTPYVPLPAADRPTLASIARTGGASALTLTSVSPAHLDAASGEIAAALGAGIALVASLDGATASDTDVQAVLAHGIRNLDIAVPAGSAPARRWATLVKRLETRYPDLNVGYTLPGTDTTALTAARDAGAALGRICVVAPSSLLGGLGLADTVQPLLDTARQVHDKLMAIDGLDAAAAWDRLGIVPVLGGHDLLQRSPLPPAVATLAGFVRANGVGLVGVRPAGDTLDAGVLPQVFAVTGALHP